MRRLALGLTLALSCLAGCEPSGGSAYAKRVTAPEDLIGGLHAIGQVGDWLIGNEKIKVIVQDQGWSRGSGIVGGEIIDADIVRPGGAGTAGGGLGKDNFGDLFPALFLRAFDVGDQVRVDAVTRETVTLPGIEILEDGADGGRAVIRTRASGGDFLTLVSELLGAAIPSRGLRFETDYIVEPGAYHLEIVGRLLNTGGQPVELPDPGLASLLEQFGIPSLQVPLGDVTLFGEGNDVFVPGAVDRGDGVPPKPIGFDLRFSIDASYSIPRALPALPGLVVDFMATSGPDVSYGFAVADDEEHNYPWLNRSEYEKDRQVTVTPHSMLLPFLMESFTGAYSFVPPTVLAPAGQKGDTFEYRRYLIVGRGDVASIRDELYRIRGTTTANLSGRVMNAKTGQPEIGASVHIFDAAKRPYSQVRTDENGRFLCRIERGTYYYRVTADGRFPFPAKEEIAGTRFDTWLCAQEGVKEIEECSAPKSKDAEIYVEIPDAAHVVVTIRDDAGRPLPAKVSVVSTYPESYTGQDPMTFLYDFSLNESRRATDLTWRDGAQNEERRFVEQVATTHNGIARLKVRPSSTPSERYLYDIYVSRGPEYDVQVRRGLELSEGREYRFDAVLRRVVDTTDWISADLHLHSINSPDSFMVLDARVSAAAAEGLEIAVATDHNVLTDYHPAISSLGLQDWLKGMVGVELTTMEMGHFNAFPLNDDLKVATRFPYVNACNPSSKKANKTSFDWVECAPGQLFDNVRQLGRHGASSTILQVNHPRDTIMGYFNQFFVNPYTEEPERPTAANYPESAFFVYPHDRAPGQFAPTSFSWDFDAIEGILGYTGPRVAG